MVIPFPPATTDVPGCDTLRQVRVRVRVRVLGLGLGLTLTLTLTLTLSLTLTQTLILTLARSRCGPQRAPRAPRRRGATRFSSTLVRP